MPSLSYNNFYLPTQQVRQPLQLGYAQPSGNSVSRTPLPRMGGNGSSVPEIQQVLLALAGLFREIFGGSNLASAPIGSAAPGQMAGARVNPTGFMGSPVGAGNLPPTDRPEVQGAMNFLAQDPEGAVLLDAAARNGARVTIADTDRNVNGYFDPNDGTIVISSRLLNDREQFLATLGHELGHAASRNDGNSIDEEGDVEALSRRILSRLLDGRELSAAEQNQIADEKRRLYVPDVRAGRLATENNFESTMAGLGINILT